GKGVIPETHPLAVGWGYGPQGTMTAEKVFRDVDIVLAIGVKYSEVCTANYAIPDKHTVIHVDINPHNLGRIVKTAVCVHADAGLLLHRLLAQAALVGRAPDTRLTAEIAALKCEELRLNKLIYAECGTDVMAFILALRRATCGDALVFVDVSQCEHWAAEA